MKKLTVDACTSHIPDCMDFIENELSRLKIPKHEKIHSVLTAEDVIACVIDHAAENAKLSVFINRFMGTVSISVRCIGSEMNLPESWNSWYQSVGGDREEIEMIDHLMQKIGSSRVSYKRMRSLNVCSIKVEESRLKSLYVTLSAMVLGVLCGLILKEASPDAAQMLSSDLFTPVYTVFLNALKLIVAPLVFFSIADSIVGFSDIKSLGRIAMKVFLSYIATSFLAVGVGFLIADLFPIGDPSLQGLVTDSGATLIHQSNEVSVSIKGTLIGIVPSDIISPFLKSDMLQIIFVAAMLGIAASLADGRGVFAQFITSANKVFSKFTAIIISVMPFAIFCSMAKMMVGMNLGDLVKVIVWVPCCFAGHFVMMIVYGVLLMLIARYNPLKFYRLFMPAILTGFSTSSSNATLPVSMDRCAEGLKISPKIYSFSIPMGATINMDGNCITLVITALFGARIFGIEMTSSAIVALIIAILSLSFGAPGIPSGNLVCIAILMPIIGIPAEMVSLVMGLYSLVAMSQTAANVTGDAVITTIVAKSENLIETA